MFKPSLWVTTAIFFLAIMACGDQKVMQKDPFYDAPLANRQMEEDGGGSNLILRPLTGSPANNRGRTISFPPMDEFGVFSIGENRRLVLETPKQSSDEAEAITVTLGYSCDDQLPAGQQEPVLVVARITWGVGGAQFVADVDWDQGKTFTLFASSIRIEAIYTVAVPFLGNPPTLELSAAVAYGTRGFSANALKLTKNFGNVFAATTAVTEIPRWATAVTVLTSVAAAQVNFQKTITAFGSAILPSVLVGASNPKPIVIPNSAAYYTVSGLGAGGTVSAVFELGL